MFGIVRQRVQETIDRVRKYDHGQVGVGGAVQGQKSTETPRGVRRPDVRHVARGRMETMFDRMRKRTANILQKTT